MKLFRTAAIAAGAGLCALPAVAQTLPASQTGSVTIYAIADVGIDVLTNAPQGTLVRMPNNTSSLPSRVGFRGTEPLGDGLSAIFTLEMGFGLDADALNQGGRGFGRQAFVGLSGPFGAVALGRQHSMIFYAHNESDVLGPTSFGMGSLDASSECTP